MLQEPETRRQSSHHTRTNVLKQLYARAHPLRICSAEGCTVILTITEGVRAEPLLQGSQKSLNKYASYLGQLLEAHILR